MPFIMWKNIVEADRSQYNMAHALCILYNKNYKHIVRICNNYCFSTATVVTRTRLNITFVESQLKCDGTR